MQMFRKLALRLNDENKKRAVQGMANPIADGCVPVKNDFLDGLSKRAVKMFEKNCEIKTLTKLALSNPENNSHVDLMGEMFEKGVIDPFEDEKLAKLADNKKLLKDLGLL